MGSVDDGLRFPTHGCAAVGSLLAVDTPGKSSDSPLSVGGPRVAGDAEVDSPLSVGGPRVAGDGGIDGGLLSVGGPRVAGDRRVVGVGGPRVADVDTSDGFVVVGAAMAGRHCRPPRAPPPPLPPLVSGPQHFVPVADGRQRKVQFDDSIDDVEVECPPWGGFKTQVLWGVSSVTENTKRYGNDPPVDAERSLDRLAAAIRNAVELASGLGRLDDPDDSETWSGSQMSLREMRGPVLYWRADDVLIYGAAGDGLASYGRAVGPDPPHSETIAREEAIVRFADNWDECIHLGAVPSRRKSKPVPIMVVSDERGRYSSAKRAVRPWPWLHRS